MPRKPLSVIGNILGFLGLALIILIMRFLISSDSLFIGITIALVVSYIITYFIHIYKKYSK